MESRVAEVDSFSARAKLAINYFRDKCVVIKRNCKFANLTQYNMQYIVHFLPKKHSVWPKKAKYFPKVRKLGQILILRQNSVC